jgi:hypothetical protein
VLLINEKESRKDVMMGLLVNQILKLSCLDFRLDIKKNFKYSKKKTRIVRDPFTVEYK